MSQSIFPEFKNASLRNLFDFAHPCEGKIGSPPGPAAHTRLRGQGHGTALSRKGHSCAAVDRKRSKRGGIRCRDWHEVSAAGSSWPHPPGFFVAAAFARIDWHIKCCCALRRYEFSASTCARRIISVSESCAFLCRLRASRWCVAARGGGHGGAAARGSAPTALAPRPKPCVGIGRTATAAAIGRAQGRARGLQDCVLCAPD